VCGAPLLRGERVRGRPEPAPGLTGFRLGCQKIRVGREAAEDPGVPFCDEFAIQIAVVEPERAEEPAVLVAGRAFHAHGAAGEFQRKCLA